MRVKNNSRNVALDQLGIHLDFRIDMIITFLNLILMTNRLIEWLRMWLVEWFHFWKMLNHVKVNVSYYAIHFLFSTLQANFFRIFSRVQSRTHAVWTLFIVKEIKSWFNGKRYEYLLILLFTFCVCLFVFLSLSLSYSSPLTANLWTFASLFL